MRAILKTKGGFEKQVDVPYPPPYEWFMYEESENLNRYSPGDGLEALADITVRKRVFKRVSVVDPEEAFKVLAQQQRYNHSMDYLQSARNEVMRRHYQRFGVHEPVVIYEEGTRYSREEILRKAEEIALKEGLISPVQVEDMDNKRFIELDNWLQDP
jgi:hypothetical protein